MNQIKEVVLQASKLLMSRDFETTIKQKKEDLVTTTDVNIQSFLNTELRNLLQDSVVYGEENTQNSIGKYTWVVDPIDGTANFTRGIPNYAISVALLIEGEIVIGVVYSPQTNEFYYAQKNLGAFLNGESIHVSSKSYSDSLFCTAMSLYKKELSTQCFDIIKEVYSECSDIRRFGSCALELCYLASGRIDLYFEIRVFPWDFAAGVLIISEAGGFFGTVGKKKIKYNKAIPLIAANNKQSYMKLKKIVDKNLIEVSYE